MSPGSSLSPIASLHDSKVVCCRLECLYLAGRIERPPWQITCSEEPHPWPDTSSSASLPPAVSNIPMSTWPPHLPHGEAEALLTQGSRWKRISSTRPPREAVEKYRSGFLRGGRDRQDETYAAATALLEMGRRSGPQGGLNKAGRRDDTPMACIVMR